ncbi:caspase-1 [Hoplias malabaricus]|uniref:caspase-1 n=1 Tax=Hoplias malabaricus TaxID=27720 RepID=UPI0034625443
MALTQPDKMLRHQLSKLSKTMSGCLVGKITTCLYRSHTLTEYEVQLIQTQATDMQKASTLILTLIRKGPRACQMFYKCLAVCNPSLTESITGCTAKTTGIDHNHFEDNITSETTGTVPPCIINIHNSSLSNCIIGNNNDLRSLYSQTDVSNEKLEDVHRPQQQEAAQDSSKASSVQMQSSNVNYVIIGDNNYMDVASFNDQGEQEEEEEESELEDSEG